MARRTYKVAGPMSLWHVDGHHKLIRWKFVILGAIDGFTRLTTMLKVSTNNRARTAFDAFVGAIREWGVPSRVRTDHGSENVLIAELMVFLRGPGRSSHIAGKSTHNQRIERLWQDTWRVLVCGWYTLFHAMELSGVLDVDNEIHLYALHFVYLPRIQESLDRFVTVWNSHVLTTTGLAPIASYHMHDHAGPEDDEEFFQSGHGPDWVLDRHRNQTGRVRVPQVDPPLDETELRALSLINPVEEDGARGVPTFRIVVDLICRIVGERAS